MIPQPQLQPIKSKGTRRCQQIARLSRAPRKPFAFWLRLENTKKKNTRKKEKSQLDKSKPHCVASVFTATSHSCLPSATMRISDTQLLLGSWLSFCDSVPEKKKIAAKTKAEDFPNSVINLTQHDGLECICVTAASAILHPAACTSKGCDSKRVV